MPVRFATPETIRMKYPLHHAIRDKAYSEEDIMHVIHDAYDADPTCISQPDNTGLRPIMVAIKVENLTAVNTLVEVAAPMMAQGEDPLGLQTPDEQQETPLSCNVRLLRESPRFVIHDLLDGASLGITKSFIEHKLPACTCGRCTSGWLSPRMRFRLRENAHDIYMSMQPKLDDFVAGQPLCSRAVLEDTTLGFIPVSILQQGVYKPFYVGYRAAFHAIRCFLSDTDAVPTVPRLRQELAMGARNGTYDSMSVEYFLERGGSIKYALDMVVHLAACLSSTHLGDGSFDRKWDTVVVVPETPSSPRSSSVSPLLSPMPLFGSPPTSPPAGPVDIKRRRRSSSIKDILGQFGKKERKSWMLDIREDEDQKRQRKHKEEWDASGDPGCALDDQFIGVRYLTGLHTTPRWDIDGQDPTARRKECQLRRM